MNTIDKIKLLTKNIDFDETAKRIFEEYLTFCDDADKILKAIELSQDNFFTKINPKDVIHMTFGRKKHKRDYQHIHHEFCKNENFAEFKEIYEDIKGKSITNRICFDNADNFVKQLINLAYSVGGSIEPYSVKTNAQINYSFKTQDGKRYCFKCNRIDDGWILPQLLYWYFYYCLLIYNEKIKCKDKAEYLKEAIQKTPLSHKVYQKVKLFFDNEDFICAIMRYLKTDWHRRLFLQMIDKNECMCVYEKMDKILTYVSESERLSSLSKGSKVTFLRDRFKTQTGKKLFDMLKKIEDNENWILQVMFNVKNDTNRKKVIDYIESGKTKTEDILSFAMSVN